MSTPKASGSKDPTASWSWQPAEGGEAISAAEAGYATLGDTGSIGRRAADGGSGGHADGAGQPACEQR